MSGHGFSCTENSNRHNRGVLCFRGAKCAGLKAAQLSRGTARPFREYDKRKPIADHGDHLAIRLHLPTPVHADQGNVARHFHGPAYDGELEDLCLGDVFDAAVHEGEGVNVEVGGVVSDIDGGNALRGDVSRINDLWEDADRAEGKLHPAHCDEIVELSSVAISPHDEGMGDEHWDEEKDGPRIGYEEEDEA